MERFLVPLLTLLLQGQAIYGQNKGAEYRSGRLLKRRVADRRFGLYLVAVIEDHPAAPSFTPVPRSADP